ncbi:MAG: envelope stress response membrane protein PspB [Thiotrichaceae bacterium]|jgi:phage shock protein B|nr:envelope stress response membrane protein PspB [Thiotrichaceae bacterium]
MTAMFTSIFSFLLTLIIGFLVFMVLPVWLFLHYRNSNRGNRRFSESDLQRLNQLQNHAANLEARVKVLETILDAKVPNWRVNR